MLLLFLIEVGYGQTTLPLLKATYIYNFATQIEWPGSYRNGDFVIYVLGSSEVFNELTDLSKTKKVGAQPLVVKNISHYSQIAKCHILFISKEESGNIARCIEATSNFSTLLVGENPGLCAVGAGINFIVINNKLNFELSKSNLEKRGLTPTSFLNKLATVIE